MSNRRELVKLETNISTIENKRLLAKLSKWASGFWNRYRPVILITPALLVTIGVLYPFILGIWYALNNYQFFNNKMKFVGLRNIVDLFKTADFWNSTSVTIRYAFWAVLIELILGIIIAMLLNRETRVVRVARSLLVLPMMIAPAVGSLMWRLMMHPVYGVANYILSFLGVTNMRWAANPATAMFSACLIDVWMFTPFMALLILAGLRSMPQTPFEAAQVDRASPIFIFRHITLPLLMPYIVVALMFRLIDSLRQFDIIFALCKGGPGQTMMNYQVAAYTTAFVYMDLSRGSAYMLISWVIIFVISQILVGYWNKLRTRFIQ